MGRKLKVSVTVDEDLMAEVDRAAGDRPRSAVMEEALSAWVARRRRQALDRGIEAYYLGLTREEKEEDDAWAALGDEAVGDWSRGQR